MDDVQLLNRIAAGDQEAFAAFYDRHAPAVFGMLMRLLPQRGDAEDALQEAFSQVWRQARNYDAARGAPLAWLLMLARSRGVDLLRRQRSRSDLPTSAEALTWPDAALAVEQSELAALVRSALTQLPEEQRSALCLAFYNGLTYEQVANQQAVPLGTVKTRIRLAMGRLRHLLRKRCDEVSA